ncbi:hypothetical protein Q7P35_000178 [Cladosporium inversicolor]
MGYWSAVVLVVSVSFLAYRHPEATRNVLPPWLRRSKAQDILPEKEQLESDEDDTTTSTKAGAPSLQLSEPEEIEQDESTPKSSAIQPKETVPSFSLSNNDDAKSKSNGILPPRTETTNTKPTSSLAPPPSPKPSMLPPPRPASSSLMPPPAPKPSALTPPPGRPNPLPNRNPAPSLRAPANGLMPNRGPPANSQQRAGASNNGRGKILLSPGHSPMDWAALARNGNLAGVPTLQRVTPSQLKTMTGRKGKPAWSSYQGKVYNITPYLPFHPGGEPELMKCAGRDGRKLFMEIHPWVNWEGMLGSCVVGILVGEHEAQSELDDMD